MRTIVPDAGYGCAERGRSKSTFVTVWLLRGMATLPQVRGEGYGTALIQTACAYVASEQGIYLWCEARENVLGFYEKLGFAVLGNRFYVPPTGPHYRMWRAITPADAVNTLF